jgi:S1-C subfamily serine protease
MKKLLSFILWPALAGLVFALTLRYAPGLLQLLPGLAESVPAQSGTASSQGVMVSFSQAIRKAAPAVVSINNKQDVERTRTVFLNPFLVGRYLYMDTDTSLGSGVIIGPDGLIVTSYHVIYDVESESERDREIIITLSDGANFEGQIVAADETNDLALLKIDAPYALPFLEPAALGGLQVGDIVLAIGNPRNIGQSVSFGIVSALLERGDSFMIQTDAAINPGNSGGALINIEGRLIGINSTIVSESGGSEGISFAIPANEAVELYEGFMASGPKGYLGVDTDAFFVEQGRARFGQDIQGFVVRHVMRDSQAAAAGIQADDIITGVNGKKLLLRNEDEMREAVAAIQSLAELNPGEAVAIEVFRGGGFINLTATLGIGVQRLQYQSQ